ncbi:hypothetical protein [Morganella morganii]|uniref:hypothetical protein n=1 Tax=Morganella morganii TaxID=582 RepID=UPI001BD9701D|nr:hypothetical protein [Morganella morganii]MBT0422614.1 hypothetical protein [Morganella morganii subsp. morganii]MBT0517245.1 hypothetical protein [Morganella morganii subsp. morganii]UNJ79674.1 hypothetical protein [Morganella morganii]
MIFYRKESNDQVTSFFDVKSKSLNKKIENIFTCKYIRNFNRTHILNYVISINEDKYKGTAKIISVEDKKITVTFNKKELIITSPKLNKQNFPDNKNITLGNLILKEIMKRHTKNSNNSPLISLSGLKTNYIASEFSGHVFSCVFKNESFVFSNNNPSGTEREYFVIGYVKIDDLNDFHYLGKKNITGKAVALIENGKPAKESSSNDSVTNTTAIEPVTNTTAIERVANGTERTTNRARLKRINELAQPKKPFKKD